MNYYDSIANGYDELHKAEQLRKLQIIKDNIKVNAKTRLLDVGCGTGFSLDYFDCECIGIDPAKELVKQYTGKKKILVGSAEQLPFNDHSFEIVISVTAIQNFTDIEKGLLEMKRVGKEKFVFSVLKRSPKIDMIRILIEKHFSVKKVIEEEKDLVFVV